MAESADKGGRGIAEERRSLPVFMLASLLCVYLFSGVCLQVLPASAPSILEVWHVPARALALPMSLNAMGTGIGTILGGMIGDVRGRRLPIIVATLLQGLAVFLGGFAPGPFVLCLSMFGVGLGYGGANSTGLALITELVPPRLGGFMVGLAVTCGPLGLSLGSLTAAFVVPHFGWASLFFLAAALAVPLVLSLVILLRESPTYLARVAAQRSNASRPVGDSAPKQASWRSLPILSLFAAGNLAPTLGLWLLSSTISLMGMAILNWVPVILATQNFSKEFASSSLSIWTLGAIIGTPLAGWLISRVGLRRAAPFSAAGTVISLSILTLVPLQPTTGIWAVAAMLAFGGFTLAGIVTGLYTQAAESYSTEMRATGIGMADGIGRVAAIMAPYWGIYVMDHAGAGGFFALQASLACVVLVTFLLFSRHRPKAISLTPVT